jgi:hypothetical protein
MKYAVRMTSFAMMYIPSFIKFSSDIQRMIREIYRHIGNNVISLAYFHFFFRKGK